MPFVWTLGNIPLFSLVRMKMKWNYEVRESDCLDNKIFCHPSSNESDFLSVRKHLYSSFKQEAWSYGVKGLCIIRKMNQNQLKGRTMNEVR